MSGDAKNGQTRLTLWKERHERTQKALNYEPVDRVPFTLRPPRERAGHGRGDARVRHVFSLNPAGAGFRLRPSRARG